MSIPWCFLQIVAFRPVHSCFLIYLEYHLIDWIAPAHRVTRFHWRTCSFGWLAFLFWRFAESEHFEGFASLVYLWNFVWFSSFWWLISVDSSMKSGDDFQLQFIDSNSHSFAWHPERSLLRCQFGASRDLSVSWIPWTDWKKLVLGQGQLWNWSQPLGWRHSSSEIPSSFEIFELTFFLNYNGIIN